MQNFNKCCGFGRLAPQREKWRGTRRKAADDPGQKCFDPSISIWVFCFLKKRKKQRTMDYRVFTGELLFFCAGPFVDQPHLSARRITKTPPPEVLVWGLRNGQTLWKPSNWNVCVVTSRILLKPLLNIFLGLRQFFCPPV